MIKASIIIPTYKRAESTKRCLELLSKSSGLGHDFNLELVVVDSSPDRETAKVIEKLSNLFQINHIHYRHKLLPGSARNIGVAKAKNELIISLDSDIEVLPNTIWGMISYLRDHPSAARMTGKSIFSSGEREGQTDRPTPWDRFHVEDNTQYIEGIYGRYEAFYRSAFQKIGGYDEIFEFCGEGTDLSIRFWRAGYPLGYSSGVAAYHNTEAPESLRRTVPDRMTQMYRSLILVAYKYDIGDLEESTNFINSHAERQAAYDNATEFFAITSAAESIDWFKKNHAKLINSKRSIPKEYDFKPFDVFTNEKLLEECLKKARKRINLSYKKVFLTHNIEAP